MKSSKLRVITALALIVLVTLGFVTNFGIGTVSAIGWGDVSLLCPLGALGTMLASKTMVPKAIISLIFAILFIALLGRAFCAWLCPVPIVQRIRNIFSKKSSAPTKPICSAEAETTKGPQELLLADEKMGTHKNCSNCKEVRGKSADARHFILGGSLLSAAIFGFPVFCLICPIGLSFATILLVIRLFSGGDVTWSLIVVPAILLIEVLVLRKWCTNLCPLSALMSLGGKLNKTFKPTIDEASCIETSKGRICGLCTEACPEGIDLRHPDRGSAWSECTKCRACVDVCPTKAITMPLFPKKKKEYEEALPVLNEIDV